MLRSMSVFLKAAVKKIKPRGTKSHAMIRVHCFFIDLLFSGEMTSKEKISDDEKI